MLRFKLDSADLDLAQFADEFIIPGAGERKFETAAAKFQGDLQKLTVE